MKRLLPTLAVVALCLSLAACGSSSLKPDPQAALAACVAQVVDEFPTLTAKSGERPTETLPACQKLTPAEQSAARQQLSDFSKAVLTRALKG